MDTVVPLQYEGPQLDRLHWMTFFEYYDYYMYMYHNNSYYGYEMKKYRTSLLRTSLYNRQTGFPNGVRYREVPL